MSVIARAGADADTVHRHLHPAAGDVGEVLHKVYVYRAAVSGDNGAGLGRVGVGHGVGHYLQQHILVHPGAGLDRDHAQFPVRQRAGLGESHRAGVRQRVHGRAVLAEHAAAGSAANGAEPYQRHGYQQRAGVGIDEEHGGAAYRLGHADMQRERQQRGDEHGDHAYDRREITGCLFQRCGANAPGGGSPGYAVIKQRCRGLRRRAGDLAHEFIPGVEAAGKQLVPGLDGDFALAPAHIGEVEA